MKVFPKVVPLTVLALLAFAGNSIICRLALKSSTIDAASFTAVRVVSGALTLLIILSLTPTDRRSSSRGSWLSAAMLFLYAVCFSFAYISLDTGIGALILFGAVQATMILGAIVSGDRPTPFEWFGWLMAGAGFVTLVSPGSTAPSLAGSLLMALAGTGWGIYSLRGRREPAALAGTTFNFVRAVPLALVVALVGVRHLSASGTGVLWASLSGALTSGVGYTIWYAALRSLSSMRAAMVQLSVPIIAAAGGIVFLSESLSARLVVSGLLVLGGIFLAVLGKQKLTATKAL